jgi:nucleoid DNA-binding protein
MLKGHLADRVAEKMDGFLKKDVAQAVDLIIETIADALADGRRVEIRGFGSFSSRQRKPKETKNPKTGLTMRIPARRTLHFTMSKSIKKPLIEKSEP